MPFLNNSVKRLKYEAHEHFSLDKYSTYSKLSLQTKTATLTALQCTGYSLCSPHV